MSHAEKCPVCGEMGDGAVTPSELDREAARAWIKSPDRPWLAERCGDKGWTVESLAQMFAAVRAEGFAAGKAER